MKTFIGYSKERKIRYNSSSGGVVTALLIYLLRNKLIDGAIVCRMNGLDVEQFIAKTEKEIIEASQSKYIDFNLKKIIKDVIKEKGRFAIVGLPCHFIVLKNIKEFSKKIKYWFGMYCGCNLKKQGTLALLKRLRVKPNEVKKISYRQGGGYGGFEVITKDGKRRFVGKDKYNYLFTLYMPEKCLRCKDFFNEYSDISFGDCWFKQRYTSILVRNKRGMDIIKKADNIVLEKVNKKKFFDQHKHSVNLKKNRLNLKRYKFILEKLPLTVLEEGAKLIKRIKSK